MLTDMPLREFGEILASKNPAPGGGSAAALAGMTAAALGVMVVNLSVGKKAFKSLEQEKRDLVTSNGKLLEIHQRRMTELIDEDTAAFNAYMSAIRMPEETDAKKEAVLKASEAIIDTPLETCRICMEILQACVSIAEYGNEQLQYI